MNTEDHPGGSYVLRPITEMFETRPLEDLTRADLALRVTRLMERMETLEHMVKIINKAQTEMLELVREILADMPEPA